MTKTCIICGKEFEAQGSAKMCGDGCSRKRRLAYMRIWSRAYWRTPKRKVYVSHHRQTLAYKAYDHARRQTPEHKAYMRTYRQKDRQTTNLFKAFALASMLKP